MDLLIASENVAFNPEIKKGSLIHCKHRTGGSSPRNGLVARITPNYLLVLFLTGINRNASYFSISSWEVKNGEWDIWLTDDLENIYAAQIVEADDG